MASERVAQALAVAAEVMSQELSEPALLAMAGDLEAFPEPAVLKAIQRARRECRRLVLADVIERIDDGRPGPEQAWQMVPRDEAGSVVWTDEIAQACASIDMSDRVAARVAFLEQYRALVAVARDEGRPVRWWPSLGHDPAQRAAVVSEAVERGRLTRQRADELVPALTAPDSGNVLVLVHEATQRMRLLVSDEPVASRETALKHLDEWRDMRNRG